MLLERSRLSVKFYLDRLRLQTAGLAAQDYPGDHPGPREWLDLVVGLLDTADAYLHSSRVSGHSRPEALSLIQDAASFTSQAYRCLGLMKGAGTDELPYSIVGPLQRWFDDLGIGNRTFFRAELLENYELRSIHDTEFAGIRNPSTSLSTAISRITWPVLRVTVPSNALGIIPHFAIVAHELGHALFREIHWDAGTQVLDWPNLRKRIATRLGQPDLHADASRLLVQSFMNWFEELTADAFAFMLTGPASFFSISDFFQLCGGGYGVSVTHPARDLRRKILFDNLSSDPNRSFLDVFEKHTHTALTDDFNSVLVSRVTDSSLIYADVKARSGDDVLAHVLAELHTFLPSTTSMIYDLVRSYLNTNAPLAIYTPAKYNDDLEVHLEPMLLAIPPIETGVKLEERQPTDFASILNVGWAVLLTKLGELKVRTDRDPFGSQKLERLHGLLLKAVELSEARRIWGSV